MRRLLALLVLLTVLPILWAEEPKEVIERAVKAHGGAANLERLAASRFTYQGSMPSSGDGIKATGSWTVEGMDKHKMVCHLDTNGSLLVIVYCAANGKGWQRYDSGTSEMSAMDLEHQYCLIQEAHVRTLVPLLRDPKFTLRLVPEGKVRDRAVVGVTAAYPGRADITLWFDRETHLLLKTGFVPPIARTPNGPKGVQEIIYEDYRDPTAHEERLLEAAGVKSDATSLRAYLGKLKPDPAAAEKARLLVRKLADEGFAVREKASEELIALGIAAVPALRTAAQDDDLEVSRRARACLEKIEARHHPDTTRSAVRLLALRAPDGAAEIMLDLLPTADGETAAEVLGALAYLAERPGGPPPVLVRALEDQDAKRREAARAVLGKDGGVYLKQPNRRLLLPGVRLPHRFIMCRGENTEWDLRITDWRFVNRFDDKEFEKP
jgi:hypothetical protein